MALYTRAMSHQSRDTDNVYEVVLRHPNGVSEGQIADEMQPDPEKRKNFDVGCVVAAVSLLEEECLVREVTSPHDKWPYGRMVDLVTKVLASDCPDCHAENVAYLAPSYCKNGFKLKSSETITCQHCFHVYQTGWLELRGKTGDE